MNAAIWLGLQQISATFWGQNKPALPTSRTEPGQAIQEEMEGKNMVGGWNEELKPACVIGGSFPNEGVVLLIHREQ